MTTSIYFNKRAIYIIQGFDSITELFLMIWNNIIFKLHKEFLYGTHTNASILSTRGLLFLRLWTFVVFFFRTILLCNFRLGCRVLVAPIVNMLRYISVYSCNTHACMRRHFAEIWWCPLAKSKRIYIKDKDGILSLFYRI